MEHRTSIPVVLIASHKMGTKRLSVSPFSLKTINAFIGGLPISLSFMLISLFFGGLLPYTKVIKDMIVFIFFAFFQCYTVILCVCPFYFSVAL